MPGWPRWPLNGVVNGSPPIPISAVSQGYDGARPFSPLKCKQTFILPSSSLETEPEFVIFREVEDRDLIAQTCKGDVEAYNKLVSRWEKRVFNYLLRLVGEREDALDLTQDVMLKAYQNLKKLDDPERFGAWLFRIAHNEAYSMLRKPKRETASIDDPGSSYDLGDAPSVSGRMLPVETSLAVTAALTKLTPEQREAVLLKVYQGFKFEEMAQILECPVSTVKSRVYSAFEILKDVLAPADTRWKERRV